MRVLLILFSILFVNSVVAAPFNLECSTNGFETIYIRFAGLESDKPESRTINFKTSDINWREGRQGLFAALFALSIRNFSSFSPLLCISAFIFALSNSTFVIRRN